jgi:hypothetical protein
MNSNKGGWVTLWGVEHGGLIRSKTERPERAAEGCGKSLGNSGSLFFGARTKFRYINSYNWTFGQFASSPVMFRYQK